MTYDLHEESAWHLTLQAAALSMLDGAEIGLALLAGPVGAAPQVFARLCWPWAGVLPVFPFAGAFPVLPVLPVLPALPVLPVLPVLPEAEPVANPWGFEVVGTTEGTEAQALS
jgi:hypothetical protein